MVRIGSLKTLTEIVNGFPGISPPPVGDQQSPKAQVPHKLPEILAEMYHPPAADSIESQMVLKEPVHGSEPLAFRCG